MSTARRLWAYLFPGMPGPKNDFDALAQIHLTRTMAEWCGMRQRAYSHRWLLDHELPSQLPDHLKPRAERLYPPVVDAVGIATRTRSDLALAIRGAMEDAVAEAYADRRTEPDFVRARMLEARAKVLRN